MREIDLVVISHRLGEIRGSLVARGDPMGLLGAWSGFLRPPSSPPRF